MVPRYYTAVVRTAGGGAAPDATPGRRRHGLGTLGVKTAPSSFATVGPAPRNRAFAFPAPSWRLQHACRGLPAKRVRPVWVLSPFATAPVTSPDQVTPLRIRTPGPPEPPTVPVPTETVRQLPDRPTCPSGPWRSLVNAPARDGSAPAFDPELARYLAAHAAPAACADALIRDGLGRILLVDPTYKDGWDLPGGMLEDEEPALALGRELAEELGLAVEVGRLLAVDTIPAAVYGRTVLALLYAGHVHGELDADALTLQDSELRAAGFFPEDEALALLPQAVRRRLAAALGAERGPHTALLRDGHRLPTRTRDHYAQLPAPMMAATVLVTDTAGRVLVLEPGYADHLELPGGMVEAHESPSQAAARELAEELSLAVPVGRLLVVDTAPASAGAHGRALTCMVFATPPLTPGQAGALAFADGEIVAAHWMDRQEAVRRLPARLAARLEAGLDALTTGAIVHLEAGVPACGDTGGLHPGGRGRQRTAERTGAARAAGPAR